MRRILVQILDQETNGQIRLDIRSKSGGMNIAARKEQRISHEGYEKHARKGMMIMMMIHLCMEKVLKDSSLKNFVTRTNLLQRRVR